MSLALTHILEEETLTAFVLDHPYDEKPWKIYIVSSSRTETTGPTFCYERFNFRKLRTFPPVIKPIGCAGIQLGTSSVPCGT